MIRPSRVFVTLAALLLALTACGDSQESPSNSPKTDKITYVTAFGAVGRDSFACIAKEKGFFRDGGINVDIRTSRPSSRS
jgi:NitT/TauT family transport system substrate-binding protein